MFLYLQTEASTSDVLRNIYTIIQWPPLMTCGWPWCRPRRWAGWRWSPRGRRWWCRVSSWRRPTAWEPPGGSAGRGQGGLSWWTEDRCHDNTPAVTKPDGFNPSETGPKFCLNYKCFCVCRHYIQQNFSFHMCSATSPLQKVKKKSGVCKLNYTSIEIFALTYTPIGPMPGPPPPWGMQNVLCRLRWDTSEP